MRASVSSFVAASVVVLGLIACGSEESPYEKEVKDPLALVSSTPAAGAQNFDHAKDIEIEFNREVAPETLELTLVGAPTPKVTVEGAVVVVTAALEFDTDYTLRIDHAEDTFGNPLPNVPVSIAFHTAADGTVTKSTLADVQPIFNRSCIDGCHTGRRPSGDLTLDAGSAYQQLVNVRGSSCAPGIRTRVTPGDPDNSCLWVLVESGKMPDRGTISAADKEKIRQWIEDGALEK